MCLPPVSLSILSTLHCLHSFNRQTQNMDQLLQQSLLLHLLIPGEQNLMQWANLARDSKIVKASSVRWVDMAWIKERKQYQTHLNLHIFFIALQYNAFSNGSLISKFHNKWNILLHSEHLFRMQCRCLSKKVQPRKKFYSELHILSLLFYSQAD